MNENENNFESLRRLLALKRYETPPPGYFNNFSGEIVARIRDGDVKKESWREWLSGDAPWLVKFLQIFEAKPAFTGAFAFALCLLLLFGIVYAQRPDGSPQELLQSAAAAGSPLAAVTPAAFSQPADQTMLAANTNASLQPLASLFNQQNSLFQQVNFSPNGN